MIADASPIEPAGDGIPRPWATFGKLHAANGGRPELGQRLKASVRKLGPHLCTSFWFVQLLRRADIGCCPPRVDVDWL